MSDEASPTVPSLPTAAAKSHRACLQLSGEEAVADGIRAGRVTLVLVAAGTPEAQRIASLAAAHGVALREESERDLWRMSRSAEPAVVLGLVDRDPAASLAEAFAGDAPAWLLSGVAYPSNVGSAIRVIEVTGGSVVCVDGPFNRKARVRATRVSMRADRFIGVHWVESAAAIDAARAAGRFIVGIEDTGEQAPWEFDLSRPALFVVGGEHDGIAPEVQARCDAIVRLPMPGFIPSFSVQSAVSIVAAEVMRQQRQGAQGTTG